MATAKGQFELASWNEDTYQELDSGGKLTRATVRALRTIARTRPASTITRNLQSTRA